MSVDNSLLLRLARRKKRKKRAAIIAGVTSAILAVIIAIAFCLRPFDRFTITTGDEPELVLIVDEDASKGYTSLSAPPMIGAVDTQLSEIPETIDDGLGSKNAPTYFAYSFYLGGMGDQETLNYSLAMSLESQSNGIEEAIRVMIIRNGGEPSVYAKADANGNAKPIYAGDRSSPEDRRVLGYTIPFRKNRYIIVEAFEVASGDRDKFTIVMWIDGWETIDSMKGGAITANLRFSTKSINY